MTPDDYMLLQLQVELEALAAAIKAIALLVSLGLGALLVFAVLVLASVHFARLVAGESTAWRDARTSSAASESWWTRPFPVSVKRAPAELLSGSVILPGRSRPPG